MATSITHAESSSKRIIVKNIPARANRDKVVIHFQKTRNGGEGDIVAITHPLSKAAPDEAIIEFEENETVRKVLQHHPHCMFGQIMTVTEFFPKALTETNARISEAVRSILTTNPDLCYTIESCTGAKITNYSQINGQWYQVRAAAEMIQDILSMFESLNSSQVEDTSASARTVEVKEEDVSVNFDEHMWLFVKKVYADELKRFRKKFKVEMKVHGDKLKIQRRPSTAVGNSASSDFKECLDEFHRFHHECLSSVHKEYINLSAMLKLKDDQISQAITSVCKEYPKVYLHHATNIKQIIFLSLSRKECKAALTAFQDLIMASRKNRQLYRFVFDMTDIELTVFHGKVTQEDVDVIINEIQPKSAPKNAVLLAAGEKVERELKDHLRYLFQNGEVVRTSGGFLQCMRIIHMATGKTDLKTFLMNILEYVNDELKFGKITIPVSCVGYSKSFDTTIQAILDAILIFSRKMRSSPTRFLKSIHILHEEKSKADSIAQFFSTLKQEWVSRSLSGSSDTEEKEEDVCVICLDPLSPSGPSLKDLTCGHVFHQSCIDKALNFAKRCPSCMQFCGKPEGMQPEGTMTSTSTTQQLPGYQGSGTIVIRYNFAGGTQGPEHPKPGRPYYGTTRTAFLPDTVEGREVLLLLRKAFDSRLTFTIGRSVTTGMDDCVIWNDIHHKTSAHGGPASWGYPDPTYLRRVKEELSAKGITTL